MDSQRGPRAEAGIPSKRLHDGDGISQEAHRIINEHGLSRSKVLEFADHYRFRKGIDFNVAPARDFKGALLGQVLANAITKDTAFVPYLDKFNGALNSLDYATSDGIIDNWFKDGAVAIQAIERWYGRWREGTERLEGFNVALFRFTMNTGEVHRFIQDFGELGNYRRGRWRRAGDEQDRVPTTVGIVASTSSRPLF